MSLLDRRKLFPGYKANRRRREPPMVASGPICLWRSRINPNARYIMGDPDQFRAVYNPRGTARFTLEDTPIRDLASLVKVIF